MKENPVALSGNATEGMSNRRHSTNTIQIDYYVVLLFSAELRLLEGRQAMMLIRALWWLFPGAFAVGSWIASFYFPSLALRISELTFIEAGSGLLVQTIIAITWIVIEFVLDASIRTSVRALQWDAFTSLLWTIFLTIFATWAVLNDPMWYFVVPTIATWVEAGLSLWVGINNAAQKPLVQTLRPSA